MNQTIQSSKLHSIPLVLTLTTLSCIAIAGLSGHAFGSFKERNGSHMWLCDSLPHDLPGARLILWGYDSVVSESTSFQDFEALGSKLRSSLRFLSAKSIYGDEGRMRPLIFIAHSLGGLIFKEAIIQMKRDEGHHELLDSIHGALFFGVPSQGMDITSMIPMVKAQPNQSLVHALGKESQLLRNQRRDFPMAFDQPDSEIVYFYETLMSPTAVLVCTYCVVPSGFPLTKYRAKVDGKWLVMLPYWPTALLRHMDVHTKINRITSRRSTEHTPI